MKVSGSMKLRLYRLLVLMSIIPLAIVIVTYTFLMVKASTDDAGKESVLRNEIVKRHINDHIKQNIILLRSMSANPFIVESLSGTRQAQDEDELSVMRRNIEDSNAIFQDYNSIAVTDRYGNQLIRSDYYPPANISGSDYFIEVMNGNEYVSDALVSEATGKLIVVIAVPVRNVDGEIVGMIERNYRLDTLQYFIEQQAEASIRIQLVDRTGMLIADSESEGMGAEAGTNLSGQSFIDDALSGRSGTVNTQIDGEACVVSYSQDSLSDWGVIIVRSVRDIRHAGYIQIMVVTIISVIIMLLLNLIAIKMAERMIQPILDIGRAAERIASGEGSDSNCELVYQSEELSVVAEAFNKLRSSRDTFKKDSEIDALTQLYNKSAMERHCKNVLEKIASDTFTAIYVIDLDHFKEVNDTLGHQVGDMVLRSFADHLQSVFRSVDLIGRFGGDEFVVMVEQLPNTHVATEKAMEVIAAAKRINTLSDIVITASIGIAVAPLHGNDYDTLFKVADNGVYYVKEHGRNGFCYGNVEETSL